MKPTLKGKITLHPGESLCLRVAPILNIGCKHRFSSFPLICVIFSVLAKHLST